MFLAMYAPWCLFCQAMAPDYNKLARHYKDRDDVVIGSFNAIANDVPEGYEMQGYPTLFFVGAKAKASGNTGPVYYKGKRSFEAMRDFIESQISGSI
mmetsp:Transcript_25744/g.64317  ORF Transcript_25744/g.64317 Transcript_25744/m.64317 type:complete len:97 (-) Transcript_25744:207-497(-)